AAIAERPLHEPRQGVAGHGAQRPAAVDDARRGRGAALRVIAFTAIHNATSTDPASVRAFLDSRYGRHFADGVNSQMHYGASLTDAIAKTTAEWMGWRITQRTSRETGSTRNCWRLRQSICQSLPAARW
ncbi:MAG: hypothetical protein ACKO9A_15850, partial [Alphaproteobacteria bacterium]